MLTSREHLSRRLEKLAELETHLSFRISRLSKLLDVQAAEILAGSGFGLTAYRILLVLRIFEETTPADMSRLMVIDKAQISRATADLETRGLVEARPDPTSRRRKLLRLTSQGRDEIGVLEGLFEGRQDRLIAQLDAAVHTGLTDAIDRLSEYLADATAQPDAAPSRRA